MPMRPSQSWYQSGAFEASGLLGQLLVATPNVGLLSPPTDLWLRVVGVALVLLYVSVLLVRVFLPNSSVAAAASPPALAPYAVPVPARSAVGTPSGWLGRSASGSLARSPAAVSPAGVVAGSPAGSPNGPTSGSPVGLTSGSPSGPPSGSPAELGTAPGALTVLHLRLRAGDWRVVVPVLLVMTVVAGLSLFGPRLLGINGDSTAPHAPGNVRVTGATAQQVDLAWDPVTDPSGVKEYRIIRADNGRQRIAITNRFYDTMDVAAGATYAYMVLAVDGAGNVSPPSAKATVLTPAFDAAACAIDTAPPTRPENLRATVVTANSVTLEWDPATDAGSCGLAGYVLFRSGQDTGISVAGTSVAEDGLEPNQSYVYSIVARDNASNDSAPVDVAVTTLARPVLSQNPCQITAPLNLHGTGKSDTTVSIAWAPPTEDCDDLDQYLIYRGATLVGQTDDDSFTVMNLMPYTVYVFTVRARNSDEVTSPASDSYMVRTLPPPDTTPPTEPTDLKITDRTPTDVRVEWTASTDTGGSGLKEYRVLLDGAFVGSTTVAGYTLSPLLPRTSHTVEVRAVDHAGNVSAKVPISFTTAQSGPPLVNAPNPDPVVFATDFTISGSNADYLGDVAIFIDGVEVAYVSSAANGTFQAIIDVDDNGYVIGTGLLLEAGQNYSITAFTPNCLCASPPSVPRDFSVV